MATTSLPASRQLDWTGNALLVDDVVVTGSVYRPSPLVNADSAITLTSAHDGKIVLLNNATASVVTLPASSGSGINIRVMVSAIPSGSHKVQVANATDVMVGTVNITDTDTAGTSTAFATASTSDTVTLNHGTSGAVTKGEWLEFTDIASGFWAVRGTLSNTSNGATPFSAAVS